MIQQKLPGSRVINILQWWNSTNLQNQGLSTSYSDDTVEISPDQEWSISYRDDTAEISWIKGGQYLTVMIQPKSPWSRVVNILEGSYSRNLLDQGWSISYSDDTEEIWIMGGQYNTVMIHRNLPDQGSSISYIDNTAEILDKQWWYSSNLPDQGWSISYSDNTAEISQIKGGQYLTVMIQQKSPGSRVVNILMISRIKGGQYLTVMIQQKSPRPRVVSILQWWYNRNLPDQGWSISYSDHKAEISWIKSH